jgi:hypothetical protein
LPNAGRPEQQDVLRVGDEAAGGEFSDEAPVHEGLEADF